MKTSIASGRLWTRFLVRTTACRQISFATTGSQTSDRIPRWPITLLWYCKDIESGKNQKGLYEFREL